MKFDPYKFEELNIKGVPVYVKNIPWANDFVYIRFAFPIGTRQDPEGKEGLAHFFEHLPFDGCKGYPTFDDIEVVARKLFLNTLNAYTNFEYTQFFGKVAKKDLQEGLSFLKDFVFYPTLDPKEIERERKVITQEIWREYSNERQEELDRKINKLFYENHTFARTASALGWHDTITTITRDEFVAFQKDFYHLGNLHILLAGDIEPKEAMSAINKILPECPTGKKFSWPDKIKNWSPPKTKRFSVSAQKFFGFSGSSIPKTTKITIQRAFPLLKNEHILFIGVAFFRELLFEEIRGKLGAVYSPQVYGNILKDHALAEVHIPIAPSALGEVENIVAKIISEISGKDPKHIKIFDEIKNAEVGRLKLLDVSVANIIADAAGELMRTGYIESVDESLKKAESVTYTDVAELVKKEFASEKLFWAIIEP